MEYHNKINIAIYKNGIKCKFSNDNKITKFNPEDEEEEESQRGEITLFSKKSQNRLAWIYSQYEWKSMITLTYHKSFPKYEESKKHLNTVLQCLRRRNIKYLWVVEFQKRGFPHYHIWMDKRLNKDQWIDISDTWLNVTYEYNDSEEAKKFHHNDRIYTDWDIRINIQYAVKYAQKQNQKWLPVNIEKYGRWWGSSRGIIVPEKEINIDNTIKTIRNKHFKKRMTQFRRNVKRAIFKWSKRKKKRKFDKRTNSGFTFILSDSRKKCIEILLKYSINDYRNDIRTLLEQGIEID